MTVTNDILTAAEREGTLCVDVETTGFSIGHPHGALRTIQLGTSEYAWLFEHVPGSEDFDTIVGVLARALHLTAHNAAFDLRWLAWCGYGGLTDLWWKTTDTFILINILYPDAEARDLKTLGNVLYDGYSAAAQEALKALFARNKWLYRTTESTPLERSGWAQVPTDTPEFVEYALADIYDGARLATEILPLVADQWDKVEREHRLARMASEASARGFKIDEAQVDVMKQHLAPKIEEAHSSLQNNFKIENPNSTQQIFAAFQARGRNLDSTDKHTLTPLADQGDDLARTLLDYREAHKGLNTTIRNIELYSSHTGRIHPSIRTLGARTGRMAASDPNPLNIPREGGFRETFSAEDLHTLITADFSSIEPRTIAALSGDEALIELYRNGGDPYWDLARYIYGQDATKSQRQAVKSIFLGRAYMGGAAGISSQNGLPVEENERGLASVDDLYPRVREFSQRVADAVASGLGWVELPSGRRVSLPSDKPYKAGNGIVQGFARDILVHTLFVQEDWGLWPYFRLPVHDEVIYSVPADEAERYRDLILQSMSTRLGDVPIHGEADIIGPRWTKT